MDLKKTLKEKRSKEGVLSLADWIGADEDRFQLFWRQMLAKEEPFSSYAAWVVDHSLQQHPAHFQSVFTEAYAALLEAGHHVAIPRNVLKHMGAATIPEEIEGALYDRAINWMGNPQQPAAIRVYSMELAYQIGKSWPELMDELEKVIQAHMASSSAGFRSRGRKTLKRIKKGRSL